MSPRSIILLVLAGAVAFGTATMVRNYISSQTPQTTTDASSGIRILVAQKDVAQGSFVQFGKHLEWVEWPEENVSDSFLIEGKINVEQYNGAVARRNIYKSEPITDASLVKSDEGGFMSAVLEPGMRAVSIPVDATTGNAGFIFPGDRVDLIVTHSIQTESADGNRMEDVLASETFIENVRVLAVDQTTDNPDNTAILAKTVTLEVSKRQAEKINIAKDLGKISLSLRSLAQEDNTYANEGYIGPSDFTRDSDVSRILMPRGASAVKVKVIRGEERNEVEFEQ
jgi:pilus assembly protein CpaB